MCYPPPDQLEDEFPPFHADTPGNGCLLAVLAIAVAFVAAIWLSKHVVMEIAR